MKKIVNCFLTAAIACLFFASLIPSAHAQSNPNEGSQVAILPICSLPPETGPCRGYFPRYYYDGASQSCEIFIYGGCDGNPNNFQSLPECLSVCGS